MSQETASSDPSGEKLGEKRAPPPPGPRGAKTVGTAAPIGAMETREIRTILVERHMLQGSHAFAQESSRILSHDPAADALRHACGMEPPDHKVG